MAKQINTKNFTTDRSHHTEHFNPVRIWLNQTVFDICKKKLVSDPYGLLLVTMAMFFDGSKSPHQFCAEYPKEQFTKLGSTWPNCFRGKSFEKLLMMDAK